MRAVTDGLSNTILLAERPPSADGLMGWWDSPWAGDTIAPARGDRSPVSSSSFGNCPNVATYRQGNYQDNCYYNAIWSNHTAGGNICLGDASVRTLPYSAATSSVGAITLVEALATCRQGEIFNND